MTAQPISLGRADDARAQRCSSGHAAEPAGVPPLAAHCDVIDLLASMLVEDISR